MALRNAERVEKKLAVLNTPLDVTSKLNSGRWARPRAPP